MLNYSDCLYYLSEKYPQYFFTKYHFTEDEIEYLLNLSSFKEDFDQFIKDRNKDMSICSSHDIAPYMYNFFGINKNELNSKSFLKKFKGLL